MFYIRPTLGLADSTSGGVLVVSNTETEKNRNRVLELKTEPNRTGSSNLGTEPALQMITYFELILIKILIRNLIRSSLK